MMLFLVLNSSQPTFLLCIREPEQVRLVLVDRWTAHSGSSGRICAAAGSWLVQFPLGHTNPLPNGSTFDHQGPSRHARVVACQRAWARIGPYWLLGWASSPSLSSVDSITFLHVSHSEAVERLDETV